MILSKLIEFVDSLKPNTFPPETKVVWVNEIEGMIQTEVHLLAVVDVVQYSWPENQEAELIVPPPYDKLYRYYLESMIAYEQEEMDRYTNAKDMFQKCYIEYVGYVATTMHPGDGCAERAQYYLSAYGMAVKLGYTGTPEEWLESLVGPQGEPFEYEDFTQEQLEALTAGIQEYVVTQTTASVKQAAQDAADRVQQQVETDATAAQQAAERAEAAEEAARASQTAAKQSENAAKSSASSAAQSMAMAAGYESDAERSAQKAKEAEGNAKLSETAAAVSAGEASASATAADQSAQAAAASAAVAESAKADVANNAQSAAESAEKAGTSETNAKSSETSAAASEEAAKVSAEAAGTSEKNAKDSENAAVAAAASVEGIAKESESWAVGGTGTRPGEDTDNAKYWAGVAQGAAGGGVITFNGRSGAVVPQAGDYTAEMVGADPSGAADAINSSLQQHIRNKSNPHGVTAEQVRARPDNWVPTADETGAIPKQTGTAGQLLGFTDDNVVGAVDAPQSGGKRTARFTVGTSTAGWTASDCDYLCDGTADDVEINAAIQALPATGGEVIILDGTYNITAPISVGKNNVKLSGNGAATVLKRMWKSTKKEGVITITSANCTSVETFKLDGNSSNFGGSNGCGVLLSETVGSSITGNIFNNCYNGIYLSGSSKAVITGNLCEDCNEGIYLSKGGENVVSGNYCGNNDGSGITVSSSHHNVVSGNDVIGNGTGLSIISGNGNTITGNSIYDSPTGIGMYDSNQNVLTGNVCFRGKGSPDDYSPYNYTISLAGFTNNYNLVACNAILGKNYSSEGGTGNEFINNKFE